MAIVTLRTLTPVHIGSGQKLIRNLDFTVEQNRVGFIDLGKVANLIGFENINQLTAVLESKKSIPEFLRKGRGISNLKLEDFCSKVSDYKASNSNANELKEHYATSLKGICIPGSSMKGAIKTSLWETLATKEKQKNWSQRDYGHVKEERLIKFSSDFIDKKLFGSNANEKTTRFLKIGDVHFSDVITSVFEVGVYNAGYNDWSFKNGQSFLAECIPANTKSTFELKLDKKLFEKNNSVYPEKWKNKFTDFITHDIDFFYLILNQYISRQLGYEIEELKNGGFAEDVEGETMLGELSNIKNEVDALIREKKSSAIVRIGGNNGWNFTTGGWVKASSIQDKDYSNLRKKIQRGREYNMNLWPKTRKMTTGGIPFGFVKIETVR